MEQETFVSESPLKQVSALLSYVGSGVDLTQFQMTSFDLEDMVSEKWKGKLDELKARNAGTVTTPVLLRAIFRDYLREVVKGVDLKEWQRNTAHAISKITEIAPRDINEMFPKSNPPTKDEVSFCVAAVMSEVNVYQDLKENAASFAANLKVAQDSLSVIKKSIALFLTDYHHVVSAYPKKTERSEWVAALLQDLTTSIDVLGNCRSQIMELRENKISSRVQVLLRVDSSIRTLVNSQNGMYSGFEHSQSGNSNLGSGGVPKAYSLRDDHGSASPFGERLFQEAEESGLSLEPVHTTFNASNERGAAMATPEYIQQEYGV